MPCYEGDDEYVEEKVNMNTVSIVSPEEGAEDENPVFNMTDNKANIIAGYIVKIDSWKTVCLDTLWVDENNRNRGSALKLIREAERAPREKG